MFSKRFTEAIKTRNPPYSLIKHQNRSQETFSLSHSAVDPEGTQPHCWEHNISTWCVASQLQHNTSVALGHSPLGHLLKTGGLLLSHHCLQVVIWERQEQKKMPNAVHQLITVKYCCPAFIAKALNDLGQSQPMHVIRTSYQEAQIFVRRLGLTYTLLLGRSI